MGPPSLLFNESLSLTLPLFISPLFSPSLSNLTNSLLPLFPLVPHMGNHRFKLSEIMPNAWFYKLKDMNNNTRNHHHHHHPKNRAQTQTQTQTKNYPFKPMQPSCYQTEKSQVSELTPSRASSYFPSNSPLHPKASDTLFPPLDSPRKSTRKPRKIPATPRIISSRNSLSDSEANDIVLELPKIVTRPPKKEQEKIKKQVLIRKEEIKKLRVRATASSPKIRLGRRCGGINRRSRGGGLSESFAVVKFSSDPRKDFRESMEEMIREHDLRAAKDLEELLACFLSLNSGEYHDVIVKVFEEIWCDITSIIRM